MLLYYRINQAYSIFALGCREGNVRLIGGSSTQEGRVEFCLNGVWGTVCDNGFDRVDASIVCRQLGFSSAGTVSLP